MLFQSEGSNPMWNLLYCVGVKEVHTTIPQTGKLLLVILQMNAVLFVEVNEYKTIANKDSV